MGQGQTTHAGRTAAPVSPLSTGNITLGIGVISYVGQLNVTAIGDWNWPPARPG